MDDCCLQFLPEIFKQKKMVKNIVCIYTSKTFITHVFPRFSHKKHPFEKKKHPLCWLGGCSFPPPFLQQNSEGPIWYWTPRPNEGASDCVPIPLLWLINPLRHSAKRECCPLKRRLRRFFSKRNPVGRNRTQRKNRQQTESIVRFTEDKKWFWIKEKQSNSLAEVQP